MKRLILALLLLWPLAAHAQTVVPPIVTKAPVVGYPYNGSGLYYGVGALGSGATSDIAGSNVTALGAALNGVIGYQWLGGLDFMAVEASVYWNNMGTGTTCAVGTASTPCSVDSQFGFEQRFKFGFPMSAVSALLPNFAAAFPGMPTITVPTTGVQHPYIMAGVHEDDVSSSFGLSTGKEWQVQPVIGAGVLGQWTNNLVVDFWFEASLANTSFDVSTGGIMTGKTSIGPVYRAGISALF